MNALSNYELLIQKLDQFIRKYYTNKIIRGSLYTVGAVLMMFILFNVLEYYFYFGTGVRKLLFFSFILGTLSMLSAWVIFPMMKYFKLGETISHEQAAHIIGDHFGDVKDKLLNILQLKKQSEKVSDRSLIEASIDQKTSDIKVVPFKNAIDLSNNKKYLKYAVPPFFLLLILLFAAPSLIKESTHRIINNSKEFEKAAPFSFVIENEKLQAVQFEDYLLRVKVDGEVLPQDAFIEINNFQYRLNKQEQGEFTYTFKNIQSDAKFRVFSGKVSSTEKTLEVLVRPNLSNITIDLDYPAYTGRRDEAISNTGDMVIPEGTKVRWNINALNADDVSFSFNGQEKESSKRQGDELFYLDKRIKNNQAYKIYISNDRIPAPDSVRYAINVVKDQFPSINVEMFTDSLDNTLFYFLGSASDDYGLKELTFNYTVSSVKSGDKIEVEPLQISKGRSVNYDYIFDVKELDLNPGEKVNFYFEVKDNDLINGSKSARTGLMSFEKPSLEELRAQEDKNEEEIKDNLDDAIEESKKVQEELKKMREKLLQKKELNWQDKKELEKLLEKQSELQQKLQNAKEKFEQNMQNQQEMNPNPEDQEKQEKLKEIFEELMDPEAQELMEKIQELMQELDKENTLQMMEDMEMNEEIKNKNMERLLELYKQLEMEKEIKEQAEKLEELAERQEELAQETEKSEKEEKLEKEEQSEKEEQKEGENKEGEEKKTDEEKQGEEKDGDKEEKSQEELKEEQEKINEEFKEVQEKMEELEEKNKELSPPKKMDEDNQEKMEEISEDLEQSKEQLEKQDNNGASKSQKNAAKKMKDMASGMMQQMQGGQQEQAAEDLKALRQLLENLVSLSFDQEELTNNLLKTVSSTPKYVELLQEQFKLKNDFQLIQDSLTALAKRQVSIESYVTEKTAEIRRNMDESLEELEERLVPEANESQRRTMKNVNDLALMLSESMEQMQQQMAGMMSGSQMCDKPGGQGQGQKGNVPMDKITEGQQGMADQLKEMQGKQKGKGQGEGLSSKDFAEAAARQAALRKALQDMRDAKGEEGKGGKELQEIIDQMDKVEEDLVNKRLDNEMLSRQQDILTRLLEAEKAEQQREYDNKRKSEQAQAKRKELPPALQDYLKKRESEIEMYKTISPDLKPYYKFLVDEYYRALKGEK